MKTHNDKKYHRVRDHNSGALFEDFEFVNCVFDNCSISRTKAVDRRSTVRNTRLVNCALMNCKCGPAIFEDTTVDGLSINDLLLCWAPLFKHVVLKGKIGNIKINKVADISDRRKEFQLPFDEARDAYYRGVDWALDISQASLSLFEVSGVPTELIRRDPATQVVVMREKAARDGWRERLSDACDFWLPYIDNLLSSGESSRVLAAPKGKGKRVFAKLVSGLEELRKAGIAQED